MTWRTDLTHARGWPSARRPGITGIGFTGVGGASTFAIG